ncbi:short transient receptor potential channel 4-like isoform X4 [Oscarella lobularis]|uniref:short transient receptor potential channel 4-like isoform X4 n=1 Tax=Oscarella lobularis TaxID=121494 RepID=UPI003313297B
MYTASVERRCRVYPIACPAVRTLLKLGADPTAFGPENLPVLYAAVKNGCPLECLEILLSVPRVVQVLRTSSCSLLDALVDSNRSFNHRFDADYVEYLIDNGPDLISSHLQPMTTLNDEDMVRTLIDLVERKRPELLRKHADDILRYAVDCGSFAAVKVLLEKGATESEESLLLLAAETSLSPLEKFSLLLRHEFDMGASNSKSRNVLHVAAESGNLGVLKRAIDYGGPGSLVYDDDADGNRPIHIASQQLNNEENRMKCLECLIRESAGTVNVNNNDNDSPLVLVLRTEANAKAKMTSVALLFEAGATVTDSKLKCLPYEELSRLNNTQLIMMAPRPIDLTLQLGTLFAKCAKRDESHRGEYLSWSESLESLAVEMIDKAKWKASDVSRDLLAYGMETQKKQFIASVPVQEKIKSDWYGDRETLKKRQYVYEVSRFLAKAFLLPFLLIFWLPCLRCSYESLTKQWFRTEIPCVAYIANAVTYLLFVILLIVDVSLKSNADTPATSPSVLDWIVFVFVVALLLQEISQAIGHLGALKSYITNWSNVFDIMIVLTFIAYYVLLFVGYYAIDDSFEIIRASFHVLGFAALISIVRFLSYIQAHAVLGPIQLSFVGIFYDVGLFLVILGTFLIGFAVSITSVYSASAKSLGASENATVHDDVSGMWPSVKILFWALFGLIELDSFEAESDTETAVGTALLALWLVLAVIVLLNMLIALISNAFQRVQDNADIEWKFARAVIVHDIMKSPPVPIPFNIIHLMALFASSLSYARDFCDYHCKVIELLDPFTLSYFSLQRHVSAECEGDQSSVQDKLREKIEEAEEEEGVRRKDLTKLRKHLDEQISALRAVVQANVTFESKPNSVPEESEPKDSVHEGFSYQRRHLIPVRVAPKLQTTDFLAKPQLNSRNDASISKEESSQDFLERLRELQESFQLSLKELQSEFLEQQGKVSSFSGAQ